MAIETILAGGSILLGEINRRRSNRDLRRQRQQEARIRSIQKQREIARTVAEARARQAALVAAEAASGVRTSTVAGAQGSIQSQSASNIAFLNALNRAASGDLGRTAPRMVSDGTDTPGLGNDSFQDERSSIF